MPTLNLRPVKETGERDLDNTKETCERDPHDADLRHRRLHVRGIYTLEGILFVHSNIHLHSDERASDIHLPSRV